MLTAKRQFYFKADLELKEEITPLGSEKHSRIPYWSLPMEIRNDDIGLMKFLEKSIAASK